MKRRWRSRTSTRQMGHAPSMARAVRLGNAQTAIPRLLAMVCILAVFISSFFMQGAARAMFVPLSLAVGFSMVASYLLSSTFVPVLSVWLLRHVHSRAILTPPHGPCRLLQASPRLFPVGWLRAFSFERFRRGYERLLARIVRFRWGLVRRTWSVCGGDHLGAGLAAGHGDFPDHRHRAIPASHPRPGRNGHRPDRANRPRRHLKVVKEAAGGGQRADDLGLPRHDSLQPTRSMPCINGCGGRRTP